MKFNQINASVHLAGKLESCKFYLNVLCKPVD